jgi:hypothetical protein
MIDFNREVFQYLESEDHAYLMLFAAIIKQAMDDYIYGELVKRDLLKIKNSKTRRVITVKGSKARSWLFENRIRSGVKCLSLSEIIFTYNLKLSATYIRRIVKAELEERISMKRGKLHHKRHSGTSRIAFAERRQK